MRISIHINKPMAISLISFIFLFAITLTAYLQINSIARWIQDSGNYNTAAWLYKIQYQKDGSNLALYNCAISYGNALNYKESAKCYKQILTNGIDNAIANKIDKTGCIFSYLMCLYHSNDNVTFVKEYESEIVKVTENSLNFRYSFVSEILDNEIPKGAFCDFVLKEYTVILNNFEKYSDTQKKHINKMGDILKKITK